MTEINNPQEFYLVVMTVTLMIGVASYFYGLVFLNIFCLLSALGCTLIFFTALKQFSWLDYYKEQSNYFMDCYLKELEKVK